MTWEVLRLPEFDEWFGTLNQAERRALDAKILVLEQLGPSLGRPHADTMERSKHPNMKELRARGTIRAFYAFDPLRRAILLVGGDKEGDSKFYNRMLARADELFDQHLKECEEERRSMRRKE